MSGLTDVENILKAISTLKDMVEARKFEVKETDTISVMSSMSPSEFSTLYNQSSDIVFGPFNHTIMPTYTDNGIEKKKVAYVRMVFAQNHSSGLKKHLQDRCNEYIDTDGKETVVIIALEPKKTSNLAQAMTAYKYVEIFQIKNIVINITKHYMQPKYEIIFPNMEDEIIKQFISPNATKAMINNFKVKMPRILREDPIALFYGLKSGNILKITRFDETSGRYVMYRCCL